MPQSHPAAAGAPGEGCPCVRTASTDCPPASQRDPRPAASWLAYECGGLDVNKLATGAQLGLLKGACQSLHCSCGAAGSKSTIRVQAHSSSRETAHARCHRYKHARCHCYKQPRASRGSSQQAGAHPDLHCIGRGQVVLSGVLALLIEARLADLLVRIRRGKDLRCGLAQIIRTPVGIRARNGACMCSSLGLVFMPLSAAAHRQCLSNVCLSMRTHTCRALGEAVAAGLRGDRVPQLQAEGAPRARLLQQLVMHLHQRCVSQLGLHMYWPSPRVSEHPLSFRATDPRTAAGLMPVQPQSRRASPQL